MLLQVCAQELCLLEITTVHNIIVSLIMLPSKIKTQSQAWLCSQAAFFWETSFKHYKGDQVTPETKVFILRLKRHLAEFFFH